MNVQPTASALFFNLGTAHKPSSLQNLAARPANTGDTVSISKAARDLFAAQANQAKPVAPSGNVAKAEFDTSQGTMALDIESYFNSPAKQGKTLDSIPLLMPSQKNIDALSSYISARMPDFLVDSGIPTTPASITYDNMGQIQLPADYPYAAEFKQALANNPVMERALRSTSALASHMVEMKKSTAFQSEYAAASSQAEIEAVVAKYRYLFSSNRH